MPKPATNPTLYDQALFFQISNLKKWGYLIPGQLKRGKINWSMRGNPTGSISIMVNTDFDQSYIEVEYKFRNEPRKYKISLVSKPSNLNTGVIWFFVCPISKRLCRKLYSIGGYFVHREAVPGCMYESQIQSKITRFLNKMVKPCNELDEIYNQLNSKYFKKTYAGKPTKRYLKIIEYINRYGS